jgi:hypothetical protein
MKKPGVNAFISYANGLPSGDITIPADANGDKFKTNTDFSQITIGKLHDYGTNTFTFKGKIGGLRVSNTSIYSASFTYLPNVLPQKSTTTFLLWGDFKDCVSKATLTNNLTNGYADYIDRRTQNK